MNGAACAIELIIKHKRARLAAAALASTRSACRLAIVCYGVRWERKLVVVDVT